jgi:clan AA aspartic protease
MITGAVSRDLTAVVRLRVRGATNHEQEINAIVDTGFDGWLSLPPDAITLLGLRWRRRGRALLADGAETVFEIYEGAVWNHTLRRIAVDEANTAPLLGMALLEGHELCVEVRNQGSVTIKELPVR